MTLTELGQRLDLDKCQDFETLAICRGPRPDPRRPCHQLNRVRTRFFLCSLGLGVREPLEKRIELEKSDSP